MTNDFEVGLFSGVPAHSDKAPDTPHVLRDVHDAAILEDGRRAGCGGLKEAYDKLFKLVLLSSMFLTFIGFVLAGDIVRYLFGEPFLKATPSLKLLFFAVPLLFLNYLSQIVNIACGKQVNVMAAEGAGLIANAALDVALIPRYGYMGASWATLLGCMTLFCANFFLMPKYIFSLKMASSAFKCASAFWPLSPSFGTSRTGTRRSRFPAGCSARGGALLTAFPRPRRYEHKAPWL